jgi:ketosteroid isomerase-like protein
MSQENLEIVRRFYDALNAGDVNTVRDSLDPDAVMRPMKGWPEPGPYVGRDTIVAYIAQLRDTWVADFLEPRSDYVRASDRVIARYAWKTVGHGPPSNLEATAVHTLREGKIREIEFFGDHTEALEAVGLSE